MTSAPFPVLHGYPGFEITLLEYLARVALHLLVFGGIAVLVFWGVELFDAVRSSYAGEREGEATER